MKYYSVKQFKDMVGVPHSTLRYCERIGLLNPTQDELNNYRLYKPADAFKLNKYKFFRSIGFEVSDVVELVEEATPDMMISKMLLQEAKLKEQMSLIKEQLRVIEQMKSNMEQVSQEENYVIKQVNDKYFLPASVGNDFCATNYDVFSKWVELLPVTAYSKRIKKSKLESDESEVMDYGISIDVKRAHLLGKELLKEAELIKGGTCLTFYSTQFKYPVKDSSGLKKVMAYMKKHDYKLSGDIYLEGFKFSVPTQGGSIIFVPIEK